MYFHSIMHKDAAHEVKTPFYFISFCDVLTPQPVFLSACMHVITSAVETWLTMVCRVE